MNSMFDKVLGPLEWDVARLMVNFHKLFSAIGLPESSGFTWGLSIVGLVIVIRIVLIPLFVKQIHASRRMQLIQPEMQKIQKKYKGKTDPESRQAMTQETMGLYKRTGTNPFSSCLPILLQSPIFIALFRVLNNLAGIAAGTKPPIGSLTPEVAKQANASTIFGAPLSATFQHTLTIVNNVAVSAPSALTVKIVCVVMIVLMSASQFTSMRQLMMKNMPASALDNPFAKQQKIMMYLMPLMFRLLGRHLRHRCTALLADHQPLVDGPAVLHHPADAGSRLTRREGPRGTPAQERQGAQEVLGPRADPRR